MAGSQLECDHIKAGGAHQTNYLRNTAMTSALNSCIVGIFDMTDRHILHGKKCPLELALAIQ